MHSKSLSLKPFFKNKSPLVLLAVLFSICLGLITAILGVAMGPAFEVLFDGSAGKVFDLYTLSGEYLGSVLESVGLERMMSRETLMKGLPKVIIVVAALKAILGFSLFFFWEWFSERISFSFRETLAREFLQIDAKDILFNEKGRVLSDQLPTTLGNDIRQVRQYVVRFFGSLPREGFQIVFLIATMIFLSPKLFVVFFFVISPVVLVIMRVGKKVLRRSTKALEHFSDMSEWIIKRLMGIETIKQLRMEEHEVRELDKYSSQLEERYYRTARAKALSSPIVETISVFGIAVTIYLSTQLITQGEASAATQVSFFSCLALLGQAGGKVGRYVNIQAEGKAALKRIHDFGQAVEVLASSDSQLPESDASPKSVRLENLSVQFLDRDKQFHLDIEAMEFRYGSIYALVGESGCGKSTLLASIAGSVPLKSGTIRGKGRVEDLCYLRQETHLFPSDVADQVIYPNFEMRENDVKEALTRAGLSSDFPDLGGFMSEKVGLGHPKFSGGQVQRLSLARLFYQNPKLILLDEVTSALDENIEKEILDELRSLAKRGSCIIMAAHRKSAIEASDHQVFMKDGKIEKINSHSR